MRNIIVVEYKGNRVLTTAQMAEVYETIPNNIKNNFANHKDRFVEGKDYYCLKGAELKQFKDLVNNNDLVAHRTPSLILWTERGANRHCKILDTDKAWQQFDMLEETYFKAKNGLLELPDFTNPVIAARAWADAMEGKMVAEKEVKLLSPKAAYYDFVLSSEDLIPITVIAKDYGKSAVWLNKYLLRKGVQYKKADTWMLYQKYADKGYTGTKTHVYTDSKKEARTKVNTCWTQKGRLFLYGMLKEEGILPTMEKGGLEK